MKPFFALVLIMSVVVMASCRKHDDFTPDNDTDEIIIDSLVPTKRNLVIWEETFITVYARGENLKYRWEADHGSLLGTDSITVIYWACPSCQGTNIIKCSVSNETGSVSDTVQVYVTD